MKIMTASGEESVNKRSRYGKWLKGYISTGAWSGWHTIDVIWKKFESGKPVGCSWHAWGVICGKYFINSTK